MNLANWIDSVFGNNDGRLTLSDAAKSAPAIVAVVVDIIMLVAEYRVLEVGHRLTGSWLLAVGFVAVSSIPFYLGQLAFLYSKANTIQQVLAVGMVLMGLCISAYYGFADLLMGTVVTVGVVKTDPLDPSTLYFVAVAATVAMIISGLIYGLCDDVIAQRIKMERMQGRAKVAEMEMGILHDLLERSVGFMDYELRLRKEYGDEAFESMSRAFKRRSANAKADANAPKVNANAPAHPDFTEPPQK